jgi:hypothetical protein
MLTQTRVMVMELMGSGNFGCSGGWAGVTRPWVGGAVRGIGA